MGKVLLEMSMSLDGYVAGPGVNPDEPMGRGGEALHDWMFAGKSAADVRSFQTDKFRGVGAVIVGRRMADLGIGPWGENPPFHAPVFVVTHRPAETIHKEGGTSYVFVTDGIEHALDRARDSAGSDDVLVQGGAEIAYQYLQLGAVDEFHLQLVPIVLGDGTRLFGDGRLPHLRLMPVAAETTPRVTHLTYAVERVAPGDV